MFFTFAELPFKFTAPSRYVFKGAEVNFSDDDDEDEENDEEENEQNDSENEIQTETNTNGNNLNAVSDESVLETSAETLSASPMSDKKCVDNDKDDESTFYLKEKKVDTTNLPLEQGIAKFISSPIHSSNDCAYPSREKKEKRESIENYSPNSF